MRVHVSFCSCTSVICPNHATSPDFKYNIQHTLKDDTEINPGDQRMCTSVSEKGHCTLWKTTLVSVLAAETTAAADLLQVAVDLETVVPRVRHGHVTVRREGQALGAVEGVC